MIISANRGPQINEFRSLLTNTLNELNHLCKKSEKEIALLAGNRLEPFIFDVINSQAHGTPFENSIELVSGQKFPDIVAKRYYGIEVKSTTQNHWKTTGNSVLESTRVEGVDRIFMLFGKLGKPVEFQCRPYEECLSEVVVTHSPRYLIDMNLAVGATIFDKMNISYDTLRAKQNPIKPIVEYYKKRLKPGEDIWWMDQPGDTPSSNMIIKIWNNLSPVDKQRIKVKALVLFPELFSNRNDKFARLAIWLVTQEAVVCHNVRDLFTAGGKSNIKIGDELFFNVPKIIKTLFNNITLIRASINEIGAEELSMHWGRKTTEKSKFATWVGLIEEEATKSPDGQKLNIPSMIELYLGSI